MTTHRLSATPYRIRPVHTGAPTVDLTRVSDALVLDDEAACNPPTPLTSGRARSDASPR